VGLSTKGGFTVKGSDVEGSVKEPPKKRVRDSKDKNLSLTLRDVETLVILLQQVKVTVGQYPFKELNQVGDTINKLSAIYEHLKDGEI
tara:strand:+ start:68 stop:331 length:264 start_codon:yes stop_codon:yes gene_type:complete